MINYSKYIGDSICINRDNHPVYFFNIQEYDEETKEICVEQIIDCPDYDNLRVNSDWCWIVDPEHDTVNLVCDTADELFKDTIRYLKEQVQYCSGLHLK